VAKQTLQLLEPIASRKRVHLEWLDGVPGLDLSTDVDASQLQQALTNLVMNGIQAMPDGGHLEVTARRVTATAPADQGGRAGEFLAVEVSDQGTGIDEGTLGHIFEPFFTTKDVGQGTGLGLSVSYGIVHEHGGWIGAESRPGEGSRFTIYLPTREEA
jgi:signal transduction histidine kinase